MHIIATLHTDINDAKLLDMVPFDSYIDKVLVDVDVQNLGKVSKQFDNAGYTLVVCLAESHIALHTWPELGKVTLDVYLCNFIRDNTEKCQQIYDEIAKYFDANQADVTKLLR